MSPWRQAVSLRIREWALGHYLVPYSRFGLEPGLVHHLPRKRPVTLCDVGANRGDFAAAVEAHCGVRRALLVEPQPSLQLDLQKRFRDDRFTVSNCALSDHAGAQAFDILGADPCSSLLPVQPESAFVGRQIDVSVKERLEVKLRTLDDLLTEEQWTGPIDLLKLDTQGTELQVLKGATRTLPAVRVVFVEVSFRSLYEGDALFPEVHEFLSAAGFRFYSIHEVFRDANRELLQADAVFLGPTATPAVTQ
jgi:FkbM family methyltransferase